MYQFLSVVCPDLPSLLIEVCLFLTHSFNAVLWAWARPPSLHSLLSVMLKSSPVFQGRLLKPFYSNFIQHVCLSTWVKGILVSLQFHLPELDIPGLLFSSLVTCGRQTFAWAASICDIQDRQDHSPIRACVWPLQPRRSPGPASEPSALPCLTRLGGEFRVWVRVSTLWSVLCIDRCALMDVRTAEAGQGTLLSSSDFPSYGLHLQITDPHSVGSNLSKFLGQSS